jgi:archaeal flagellin FlaB
MNFQKMLENAFTGLEAAIVLIAFVVVAAVFSYVVLGSGFLTTQKSQETVHSGVVQTTSSVHPSGDVSIKANAAGNGVSEITFYLMPAAGSTGTDMKGFSYTVATPNGISTFDNNDVTYTWVKENPGGGSNHGAHTGVLNPNEMVLVTITKEFDSTIMGLNTKFIVEIKPAIGAAVPVERRIPAAMTSNNWYIVY